MRYLFLNLFLVFDEVSFFNFLIYFMQFKFVRPGDFSDFACREAAFGGAWRPGGCAAWRAGSRAPYLFSFATSRIFSIIFLTVFMFTKIIMTR